MASAFGVYRYLTSHGVEVSIVYGGEQPIKKCSMKMLLRECGIPLTHSRTPSGFELLLLVDCQYGQTNAERFEAREIAIIDHNIQVVEDSANYFIKSRYQSCSTIVYELLLEEGYPVEDDLELVVAFLYGLYTDTASFADLFYEADIAMKAELFSDQPLFERLIKSSMTVAELLVASDAMYNHYFDVDRINKQTHKMRRNRKNMNISKQINDEMLDNVVGGTSEVEVTQYESLTIGQRIRLWNGAGSPSLDENFSWGVIIGFKAPFIQFDLENKEALGEAENPAWIHIQLVRENLALCSKG